VLASLIASAKNLLVLDEPTNHLDIPSAERLEEALDRFGDVDKTRIGGKGGHGGVLLLISHDRALLDDVCDKLVILDGEGNTRVFDGSYRDWEAKEKSDRAAAAAERSRKPSPAPAPKSTQQGAAKAGAKPNPPSNGKPGAKSNPPSKSRFANLPLERIEARIADIGRALPRIDADIADPKVGSDATTTKKLLARRDELHREQSELEEEWLRKSG